MSFRTVVRALAACNKSFHEISSDRTKREKKKKNQEKASLGLSFWRENFCRHFIVVHNHILRLPTFDPKSQFPFLFFAL